MKHLDPAMPLLCYMLIFMLVTVHIVLHNLNILRTSIAICKTCKIWTLVTPRLPRQPAAVEPITILHVILHIGTLTLVNKYAKYAK